MSQDQHRDENNNVVDDFAKLNLEWGYEGVYGPENWKAKYPLADGKHQSPIDINTASANFDSALEKAPLTFFYDSNCFPHILNTGSSFKVDGPEDALSKVIGGPVSHEHKFLQFHMHWGKDDTVGSEHLVDGKSYAGELHFVNWNAEKYSSPADAVKSSTHDGLIVLGVFVEAGEHNAEFEKIIKTLSEIALKDQETDLKESLDYKNLFPSNTSNYWNYEGSLTTPPCSECVQWVVFQQPIQASAKQLAALRDLYICKRSGDCCEAFRMHQNFRPVCDLNSRAVRKSFK